MTYSDGKPHTDSSLISLRRALFFVVIVAGTGGAVLGLVGSLLDWSNGVAFAACAVGGTITSLIALRENPFEGVRLPKPGRGRRRHA